MKLAFFTRLRARVQTECTEKLWPCTVTICGHDYAAAKIEQASGLDLSAIGGGFKPDQPLVFRVRKALLAADNVTPEEQRTVVTCGGVDYLLSKLGGKDASDSAWTLTCNLATR